MKESQTHSKGGRPTKYKPEYAEQIIEYFESYLREPFIKECTHRKTKFYPDGTQKETEEEFKVFPKAPPTIFNFSRQIGISDRSLERWAKQRVGIKVEGEAEDDRPYEFPEFCRAYKQAIKYQKEFFNVAGSSGLGSTPWLIFAAKNMIGWRDKIESGFTDTEGKDRPMPDYVILPAKLPDEKVKEEFTAQIATPYIDLPAKLPDTPAQK